MIKIIVFLAALILPVAVFGAPEVYRIGDLEIRVYWDQVEMVRDLPPVMRAINELQKVLGWYDKERKIIYSINNPRILEHEMKHYREPDWTHPANCIYLPC